MSKAAATLHSTGGLLLAIALVRLTSATSELPYWETDPAIQFVPETTITPAMSLALDAVTWLLCGAVFLLLALRKQRIRLWMIASAMAGGYVAFAHGFDVDGLSLRDDFIRGSLWASSMIGAVTLAHLASDRVFRRLCFACLAGVAIYLSAKGAFQVLVEFPRYLQHFEQNKEQILAAQGMAPGSPQALIYERRVLQPAATGWGGLSNSFGTVVAAGTLAWLALTLGARKVVDKDRSGLLGVIAVAGLVSLAGLWFSQSRAAMALAVLVAVAIPLARRLPRAVGRVSIIGLCALALLGVVAQGLLGPDTGDLSLYFRAQYWQGALGVFTDNPAFGVGAGSFKDAFLLHRPPTCPEEVDSPHSVFIDWLAAMGLFALPWIGITLAALWRAGTRLVAPPEDESADEAPGKANRLALAAIALLVFAWGAWLEWPTLLPDELFVRALACGLWIGASFVYFGLAPKLTPRLDALLWALMVSLVAVHSMIEMTAVMPTTVMWAMCTILIAGAPAVGVCRKVLNWLTSVAAALIAMVFFGANIIVQGPLALFAQEAQLQESARTMASLNADMKWLVSEGGSRDQIRAVLDHQHQELEQLRNAELNSIQLISPEFNLAIMTQQVRLIVSYTQLGFQEDANSVRLDFTKTWIGEINEHSSHASSAASLWNVIVGVMEQDRSRMLPLWECICALDPWGLEPAQALYRLHRELGQTEEARQAALRLLEIDDAKHLDPLRGLSEGERTEVEAFLQETAPEAR